MLRIITNQPLTNFQKGGGGKATKKKKARTLDEYSIQVHHHSLCKRLSFQNNKI